MLSLRCRLWAVLAFCVCGLLVGMEAKARARYVFLMIGDGMGACQVEAFEKALAGFAGQPSAMSALPARGMQRTASLAGKITDSAASATALACGQRTHNGMLAVDPSGAALKTMAEEFIESGAKAGILTSVTIDHATPAAFYAHVSSRGNTAEIARTLAESSMQFFAGKGMTGANAAHDGLTNLERAQRNGFAVVRTRSELAALSPGGKALVLIDVSAMDKLSAKKITLAELVSHGIRLLENDKGFFMMVEGGRIDGECHGNNLSGAVKETKAFDDAVRVAFDFYQTHPQETLIVVTADHETGGLEALPGENYTPKILLDMTVAAPGWEAELKTLKARRASCDEVLDFVKRTFRLDADALTEEDIRQLNQAWTDTLAGGKAITHLYGIVEPIVFVSHRLCARLAGYRFTTTSHTAQDVPVMAMGVEADSFAGTYDNFQIYHKIKAAWQGSVPEKALAVE